MREHLQISGSLQYPLGPTHGTGSRRSSFSNSDDDTDYSATFRELFCVTAQDIARSLGYSSLQNLGCLYEDVLTTGTLLNKIILRSGHGNKAILAADAAANVKDVEAGVANPILFGKGQLLVLTKQVDTVEANRLQDLGYRFARMEQVGDHLARSLQISRYDLEDLVSRLHSFSERSSAVPTSGTYLASFLIQPSPGMKGLDVIVPRGSPDRLPMVKFSDNVLDNRQLELLISFDGISMEECLARIDKRTNTGTADDLFLERFRSRIADLLRDCPEAALIRAVFSARQLDIEHGMTGQKETSPATVFAFCGIKDIYIQSLQSLTLKTIPLSFFQTYLRSYPGCPDHAILAQRNHQEFSSLMRAPSLSPSASIYSNKWPGWLRARSKTSLPEAPWVPDSSSQKGLVLVSQPAMTETASSHPWGGIMVTSTQNMSVDEHKKGVSNMEMRDLGVKSEAGVGEIERQTLADRLLSITTGFRDPHAARALPKELYYGRK
jgi:hypothetical protein